MGHSGGIKPIINSLEIFRDDFNLTAKDWGTDVVEEHKWKISDTATFASNIGLILYSCSEGAEQKVMLTHNEHIIDFDWDSECPMPEVSTEVSVDNNNNNTDVSGGSNNGNGNNPGDNGEGEDDDEDEDDDCDSS